MRLNPTGDRAAVDVRPAVVYAALAAGAAVYLFRLVGAFTRYPGTHVDARFNQVILEHLWLWGTGRADGLSDPAFFYPYKDILYFSDCHFGSGFVYALARATGASREAAFDLWFLVGMAATFAAAHFAFRRLGLAGAAAAVGAFLFTFSLPMLAQDAHAQLVYRFGAPLALLASLRFLARPTLRDLAATALWTSWQFLCSVYIGVFLVEMLALVGLYAAISRGKTPEVAPRSTRGGAIVYVAAALSLAAAAFMMARYAEVARLYDIRRDVSVIGEMAPRWSSFFAMAGSPVSGWLAEALRSPSQYWIWEHQLFPGVGTLILAGVGVAAARREPGKRRALWFCAALALGMVALALDVDGYGLYRVIAGAPGFNAIRSPGRIAILAALPLAWLAALGVQAALTAPTPRRRLALIAGLGLALLDVGGFIVRSVDAAGSRARVAAMEAGLDGPALHKARAVLMRFGNGDTQDETLLDVDLMIAAQDMGVAAFNGYSGSYPPLYKAPHDCAEAKAWLARADALPFVRAGGGDAGERGVIVPLGACDPAPPKATN